MPASRDVRETGEVVETEVVQLVAGDTQRIPPMQVSGYPVTGSNSVAGSKFDAGELMEVDTRGGQIVRIVGAMSGGQKDAGRQQASRAAMRELAGLVVEHCKTYIRVHGIRMVTARDGTRGHRGPEQNTCCKQSTYDGTE